MNVNGTARQSIWLSQNVNDVEIFNQNMQPHKYEVLKLTRLEDAVEAIAGMQVRGAPLIGVTAAYGIHLALREEASVDSLDQAYEQLLSTLPTALNLKWALDEMMYGLKSEDVKLWVKTSLRIAESLSGEEVVNCKSIGVHGADLKRNISASNNGGIVNILTHCNAGWLAAVDWGTALAPIYAAFDADLSVNVWVDETRPRNQGASLTAWELSSHGMDDTLIVDNAGGHLMQHGMYCR